VWIVTIVELVLVIALLLGFFTRPAAFASGVLLLLFALGMTVGTGVKSALNASVFAASAGAFALSTMEDFPFSLDRLRSDRAKSPSP
jgi:thiosulfate dehydrogenase [quinone] large subunit